MSTHRLALTGLMTAVTCILGPIAIAVPFSPVPFSLGLLAIMLSTILLEARLSVLSCLLYLLIGSIGLPVFSGFTGGIGILLGPTGGYLLGYLFLPISNHIIGSTKPTFRLLGNLCGLILCYICGTIWLMFQMNLSFYQCLLIGVVPYIPWDILKLSAAWSLGNLLSKRLKKTGILPG